jgi:peptidylprolyl isomerase
MLKTRPLVLLSLAAIAVPTVGCGDSTEPSTADKLAQRAEEEAANRPALEPEKPVVATKTQPTAGEKDLSSKPQIPKSSGRPPNELVAQDLIVGRGRAAKTGDQVSVQYVGTTFKGNKEFDTSWKNGKPGKPFDFQLGAGNVIQGWDKGVVGMKVGGRRKLIIPANLAYGAQGSPPKIGPNEALVFEIDLKKIK